MVIERNRSLHISNLGMAYINYAPMRIGTEDPWALTELAKAGGLGVTPHLGNLPLRALVCDGAITGWLGYG